MKSLSKVSRGKQEHREDERVERKKTARTSEERSASHREDTFEWVPPERKLYFAQTQRSKLMARWIVGREPGVAHRDERTAWQQTYRAIFKCGLGEDQKPPATAAAESHAVTAVAKDPEIEGAARRSR
jgi:hypothetical protein